MGNPRIQIRNKIKDNKFAKYIISFLFHMNTSTAEKIKSAFLEEVTTFLQGDVSGLEYFYSQIDGIESVCTLSNFSKALTLEKNDMKEQENEEDCYSRAVYLYNKLILKMDAASLYYSRQ